MTFTLRRTSGIDGLSLTREHDALSTPRDGVPDWSSFQAHAYDAALVAEAASHWHGRAHTEFRSFTHFSRLLVGLQTIGAPLDWCGAMARMVSDELRHTDLCLRMSEALGGPSTLPDEDVDALALTGALLPRLRVEVMGTFLLAETLSVRMFTRCLHAATVPLAREVVTGILVDETRHQTLGWELGALLMRPAPGEAAADIIATMEAALPSLFLELATQCHATRGRGWAQRAAEVPPGENFGTLTEAGYARAFFDGMELDVVPGLMAIGLGGADVAWRTFSQL